MKYIVLRQHYGDRQYMAGEIREIANAQDAQTLITMGLIAPYDRSNKKAKAPPRNKAEPDMDNKDE